LAENLCYGMQGNDVEAIKKLCRIDFMELEDQVG
jgi:hypothetical protein